MVSRKETEIKLSPSCFCPQADGEQVSSLVLQRSRRPGLVYQYSDSYLLSSVSRGLGKTASLIRIYAAVYSLDRVARISASHIILRNSKLKHGFGVYAKCKGF